MSDVISEPTVSISVNEEEETTAEDPLENDENKQDQQDLSGEEALGVDAVDDAHEGDERNLRPAANVEEDGYDTDLEIEEQSERFDTSGHKLYVDQCEALRIVPVSFFVRNMNQQEIDLKHHGIGPKGAKAIAVSLVSNTNVLQLNLSDNGLDYEGGVAVANMLKENCYISHLDVSFNKLGLRGGLAIADTLQSNMYITNCNLSGNELSDKTAEQFAEALKVNYKLKELDLSHNKLSESAGTALGPAIAENEGLHMLDLSWNHFRGKGAVDVAMGLKANQVLKRLNLSYNGFGNAGALAIGDALKVNSTLLELDVSNNRLTAEGAALIAKALEVNDTLKVLKIGRNPLTTAGVLALLSALVKNTNSSIEELAFTDITISEEIAKMIEELKQTRPELHIEHGGIGAITKPKPRQAPMIVLKQYIEDKNLRLVDFFNQVDKDKSLSVSPEEFRKGLQNAKIPLKEWEITQLIAQLDSNDDGEIDFSELVEGAQNATEDLREQKRLDEKDENAKQSVLVGHK